MTDPIEQFMRHISTVSLTSEERASARRRLQAHAAAHPPRPALVALLTRHAFAYALAAAVLFVGGTGVMAHYAMPGDALYTVKRAVNDRIALAVEPDTDARLALELDQLERAIADEERALEQELRALESELAIAPAVVTRTPLPPTPGDDVSEWEDELRRIGIELLTEESEEPSF